MDYLVSKVEYDLVESLMYNLSVPLSNYIAHHRNNLKSFAEIVFSDEENTATWNRACVNALDKHCPVVDFNHIKKNLITLKESCGEEDIDLDCIISYSYKQVIQ